METGLDFFLNIITGGETWIDGYYVETKRQSKEFSKFSKIKKTKQVRSNEHKGHVNRIFYFRVIVHREWIPQSQGFCKS